MSAPIPKFFDFSELLQDDAIVNELPNFNCKIGVLPWKSLYWSISFGYLLPHGLNYENFNSRLKLINAGDEDLEYIKHLLNRYNPFRNRLFIFYDEIMKKVIERFSSTIEAKIVPCSTVPKNIQILEISARFLNCRIAVICCQDRTVKFYLNDVKCSSSEDVIVLYVENENEMKKKGAFAYGLEKEQALKLKSEALESILLQAKVSAEYINKIMALEGIETNFIISILKNGCECVIPDLYRSRYFIGKLTDAGYQLDPKVTANGLSAFHYALLTGKKELLYTLYDSEIIILPKKGCDVRNPNSSTVSNLFLLGNILQRDKKESNELEAFCEQKQLKEDMEIGLHELYRLNSFQSKVAASLLKIRQKINYRDDVLDKKVEVDKIKESIKTILTICKEFYFANDTTNSDDIAQQYEDFVRYRDYSKKFQFYAALFIFDNLHSLEKKGKFSSELIPKLKSSFFMSVYSLNFFSPRLNSYIPSSNTVSKSAKTQMLIVPFLERLSLQKKMKSFEMLFDSEFKQSRSGVPTTEILLNLADFPAIKNELLISRLEHYIDVALKDFSGPTSILVIERALQVLGESLTSKKHSPRSFNRLLRACLPQEIVKSCIRIRNLLSHMEDPHVIARLAVEENVEIFIKLQKDLEYIKHMFVPVFELQYFEIYECMMSRGKELVDENIEYSSLSHDIFDAFLSIYEAYARLDKIERNNSNPTTCIKFKTILKNLFDEVECNLGDKELLNKNSEDLHTFLDDAFWPLECILKFISKYGSGNRSEILLKMIEMRQNLCKIESIVITEQFILNLKKLLSIFKEVLTTTFPDLKQFEKEESIICHSIEELKTMLEGTLPISSIFTKEEREEILKCIPENTLNVNEAAISNATSEASESEQKKASKIPRSVNNYDVVLKEAIKNEKISTHTFNDVSQNTELPTFNVKKIKKLRNEKGSRLCFLRKRIKQLKLMLIENDTNVKSMYEYAHSVKTKSHMIDQIVQNCLTDPQLQAVVEMLIFDCMTVLDVRKDLRHLWTKRSHLFTSINMRNVLAHGDPLLESIASLLDPEDLPTEIVSIALLLIKDGKAIEAIDEWAMVNDGDKLKLRMFMSNEEDEMEQDVRKKIEYCDRWESYAELIPRDET